MRKYFVFLWVVFLTMRTTGQERVASYDGTLQAFSKWYAGDAADSIYGIFSTQMKGAVTAEKWRELLVQIKAAVGDLDAFKLDESRANYKRYGAAGSKHTLVLVLVIDSSYHVAGLFNRPNNYVKPVYHTNYKVAVPGGELHGELLMPARDVEGKIPVVLVIAGSGPTDRDGNNPLGVKAAPYRMLAEALQQRGIASYRFDKRYTGESINFTGRMDSLRFEDYVNDAVACIRKLKADAAFSRVIVIGHSEGALIGAIAVREGQADGFVSLAGVGEPAEAVLRRQLARQGRSAAGVEKALDSLKAGVEGYIASWNRYDPAREIGKLKMPVIIIQGLTDLQVGREDAEKLKAAAPKAGLVLIDSMNHVLKDAPMDRDKNIAAYGNDQSGLDKELVERIVGFVKSVAKK
ncbi:alpha/beta hydrolase [Flavitalea sp. BT771]|uniref:alpha/beta hydrolase n=1 Tax=Flavitalea sp. BT771 TaxID=3063329 RepID=UPI0026E17294|nr:alpha/beta hydrolase [Flavitalea sp. BT771]MDO6434843.1 alpha/beta hydrolase [Flavitalea sp. BT771]MDV6223743.1 alpha/beta hydrolase [Flavitalea sp. BT771]